MKLNIVRSLNKFGCNVVVVPYDTPADEIEFMKPDGVFLSNGPGDPEDVTPVINTVRALRGKYPIFGICLGHQMISLAYGAKTYKLKFGHRGGNHPVTPAVKSTLAWVMPTNCWCASWRVMQKNWTCALLISTAAHCVTPSRVKPLRPLLSQLIKSTP